MDTINNTILITGGTSGIGLAFAIEFYQRKNKVIICGRRKDKLDAIAIKYPGMIIKECDVSLEKDRIELTKWIKKEHPDCNVLMNNAGVQYAFNLLEEMDLVKLQNEITTNLIAPIHLANLFKPIISNNPHSAIMNVSSGLAFAPLAFMPVYCATKAAIHSFTLSLRHQFRNTTTKVFEIIPPSVDTELGHDRREDKTQSHGGMPIQEFLEEAMLAIENDMLEAPIAMAKNLREKGEQMFLVMNERFN